MNKIFLMGRLTKDPEMRYTQSDNTPVASFTIAVDRRFSKKGEQKNVDFFNIIAWNKQAEFCSKYFSKGLRVLIEGRIENKTWEDKEGKKHHSYQVIVENSFFADSKRGNGAPENNTSSRLDISHIHMSNNEDFYSLKDIDNGDELPF